MSSYPSQPINFGRMIRKFLLSCFVLFSFIAYVVHDRFSHPDSPINPTATPGNVIVTENSSGGMIVPPPVIPPTATEAPLPTATPTSISQGMYRDGVYTGPQVDVYYGIVQVQASVQDGRIADVQFLQYPNDRRTSQRINSIAMPWLQQEAVQAQTANVDIISGATLTSKGFIMSLDAALNSAKN